MLEQFQAGQFDTLRTLLPQVPDDTGMGQFLRGLFEESGDEARFYFDRVIVFHSGSPVEPYAMQRLWQYHHAKGDMKQAERYYGFLKKRHPDFAGLEFRPDFSAHGEFDMPRRRDKKPEVTYTPQVKQAIEQKVAIVEEAVVDKPEAVKKSGSGNWTVQVGAFTYRSGASKRIAEAEQFGETTIRTKLVNGQILSLVHVGQFEHREDAEKLVKKIQTAAGLECRAVAIK